MKFCLIGLDGADPDLIQKFDMPNLKAVMKNGSFGKLRSTLPPITAPAWSSIITGRDPSWHGVMHFVDTDPFFGKKQIVSSRSIRCKKIWQILNDHNLNCGIYTVPMTYPVEKINGFMVSGILTPGEHAQIYPEIDIKVRPFVEWQRATDLNIFYNDIVRNTKHKFRLLKWLLLKRFNVDFLFMVESNTDSIQHRYFFERGLSDERIKIIEDFFNFVDGSIGELLENVDCPVLFISDHGFGKHPNKIVYGNMWLYQKGLLNIKEGNIDWKHTKTYFYNAWLNCGFIKNNVDNVFDELKKEHWVDEIFLAEDIYNGPFTKDAPDIIFTFKEEYTGNINIGNFDIVEDVSYFPWTGHRMDGFWACSEKISLNNLNDIAPSILKMMGLEESIKELGSPIEHIPNKIKKKINEFQ